MAAGTFAKAASIGAKTVNWPLFSVLTRLTFGLSLPETAATSVLSSGLLEAAVATGSWAMPSTEPEPLGTAWAYAAQPGPTRPAMLASALEVGEDVIEDDDPLGLLPALLPPLLLPQAAAVSVRPVAARAVRMTRGFMISPMWLLRWGIRSPRPVGCLAAGRFLRRP